MNHLRSFSRLARPLASSHRPSQRLLQKRTAFRTPAVVSGAPYSTPSAPSDPEPAPSRFPVPDPASLPPDVQARIDEIHEKSGFVPNVFKALSYRPDEFRAFFAYYDALMEKKSDTLTKAEKELIVVVTSSHNDCLYCVIAHSALHRIYSKNKYVADQVYRTMNHLRSFSRLARPLASSHRPSQRLLQKRTAFRTPAVVSGAPYSTPSAPSDPEPAPSRFPVPDPASLPPDVQARIDEIHEKSGFVPNVFKALSYRPDEFRAFFAYYDALMEKKSDTLTKAEKELIVVVTSSHNDCLYCVIAHSALHRIYSKNKYVADQLAVNWETADISDRERAIAKFAMGLCEANHISDAHIEELRTAGLTADDVWDVGAITALFALSNRMAHLTRMAPNPQFHLMGRVKHQKKAEGQQ